MDRDCLRLLFERIHKRNKQKLSRTRSIKTLSKEEQTNSMDNREDVVNALKTQNLQLKKEVDELRALRKHFNIEEKTKQFSLKAKIKEWQRQWEEIIAQLKVKMLELDVSHQHMQEKLVLCKQLMQRLEKGVKLIDLDHRSEHEPKLAIDAPTTSQETSNNTKQQGVIPDRKSVLRETKSQIPKLATKYMGIPIVKCPTDKKDLDAHQLKSLGTNKFTLTHCQCHLTFLTRGNFAKHKRRNLCQYERAQDKDSFVAYRPLTSMPKLIYTCPPSCKKPFFTLH